MNLGTIRSTILPTLTTKPIEWADFEIRGDQIRQKNLPIPDWEFPASLDRTSLRHQPPSFIFKLDCTLNGSLEWETEVASPFICFSCFFTSATECRVLIPPPLARPPPFCLHPPEGDSTEGMLVVMKREAVMVVAVFMYMCVRVCVCVCMTEVEMYISGGGGICPKVEKQAYSMAPAPPPQTDLQAQSRRPFLGQWRQAPQAGEGREPEICSRYRPPPTPPQPNTPLTPLSPTWTS